ncbi:MAG: hypothetical protein AB7U46_09470 [Paenirhodobacter sp.]|uniref:hypothetical protein n=1 Tax=Paenirhodobacter sp. TaxID=1965326 RepID=UPI003D11F89A
MPPANASLADTAFAAPRKRFEALATVRQILLMALPFMLGAIVTSALNLGKIAILAHAGNEQGLNTLSLLQPAFIFVLAVMEGLAITNQVFSARSKNNWPRRGIAAASWRLSLIGIALLSAIALAAYGLGQGRWLAQGTIGETLQAMPLFVLSMAAFVVFDICYAALRGQGKLARSLLPFIGLAVIDLSVTYTLSAHYGWGFEAVLVGNLAGPLAMLPITIWLLRREAGQGPAVPAPALRARLGQLLLVVGLPLAASILAGAISAAVIFPALADLGRDYASGFMVVLRFRIAFMIPAIAFGSVIAILINQAEEEGTPEARLRYILFGVPLLLIGYGILAATLPYYSRPVLDLLLSQRGDGEALRGVTEEVLTQLQITFFLVAAAAMLQVILEQLGRAPHVFVITIVTEALTCGATLYAIRQGGDLNLVLLILKAVAGLSFAALLVQMLLLVIKMRRANAV